MFFSKRNWKIIAIVSLVAMVLVDAVYDILLYINAYVDGKYLIEPSPLADTYYFRISSLADAMFINLHY